MTDSQIQYLVKYYRSDEIKYDCVKLHVIGWWETYTYWVVKIISFGD